MQTEFEFTLPKGYVDSSGEVHKHGKMRLATAADEILPPDQAKLPTLKDTNNVRPLARYSFDE